MQINIHSASHGSQSREVNGRKSSRQGGEIKMTLKEYLQSVNLKRRISSRSKQKRKSSSNDPNPINLNPKQIHHLYPPTNTNPTIQFYKLNQQWKAITQFSSWISQLKQICRDFIKKDQQYIQVVRLIEKIAQFVKREVETIRRDHLLLESFLVTEASYWGEGEVGNVGGVEGGGNGNFDKLSNYIKAVLSTNSQYSNEKQRTNDKHQIGQTIQNNHNHNHIIQSPELSNNNNPYSCQQSIPTNRKICYKTSTQPKTHPSSYTKHVDDIDVYHHHHYNHRASLSSGKICMQVGREDCSREYKIGSIKNPKNENSLPTSRQNHHYIYSFNDKHAMKTHNNNHHHAPQIIITNPHINPFHHSTTTNKISEQSCTEQLGLLRIQSRNQDQVLRLSLMSRFDQHKEQQRGMNEQLRRIEHDKVNTTNMMQQQQGKQTLKPTLRQRRHKAQRLSQQNHDLNDENQFQMIKLYQGSAIKVQVNRDKLLQNRKLIQASPSSSIVRQSPHVISIETPSTLRRRYEDACY